MKLSPSFRSVSVLLCLALFGTGCSGLITSAARPIIDDLTGSFLKQNDLDLARAGAPAFLLVLDGLIEGRTENEELLLAGARAYAAYAGAFVAGTDPERAARMYTKAKNYALDALSLRNEAFAHVVDSPHGTFARSLTTFEKEDVPALFWAASCWAGWIQASTGSWDAIAEIPRVESMIGRVLELDETYYHGGPHLFMGVLLTIRPPALGGRPEEARVHFERALEISGGRFLMAHVMYAKQYARLLFDRELHDRLLNEAIEAEADAVEELTLVNTVAQEQAREILASGDEYF